MRPLRLVPAIVVLALLGAALVAPDADAQLPRLEQLKADLVVVYKAKRQLQLRREGEILKIYRIALGSAPRGAKRKEGDGRTPEGVYTLDWRNARSNFYRSIHVSYPHPRDLDHAERWGVSPGGLIMLHGLPNGLRAEHLGHPWSDWTNGCIGLTNQEMDEIWAKVDDGTPIIIYP
jgi:murein L,D-transpeptidase YafK